MGAAVPGLIRSSRVPPDVVVAAGAQIRSPDAARLCRSRALRQNRPRKAVRQTLVRCTCDRSFVVAVGLEQREGARKNCGTPTQNKRAAKMMALCIAARWGSEFAPHRPP